jgi:uncharacterized protein
VRASGPKDNRRLESRADVLLYTSEPLTEDLDVVGPIAAELFVRSSLKHTDFFARYAMLTAEVGQSMSAMGCDGFVPKPSQTVSGE